MQKAIRRGLEEQALCSFFAGYDLLSFFPGKSTALAIQTNFINRLMVIATEDIGLANPLLLRAVLPILWDMSTERHTRKPELLAAIIKCLVASPKSRLCSHLAYAYKNWTPNKDTSLKSRDCFMWLDTPDVVFTKILLNSQCVPFKSHFALLRKIYNRASKSGKPAFFRYMLALAHFLNVDGTQGEFVTEQMKSNDTPELINIHVEREFRAPLEESVDVHTQSGRKAGADVKRFRQMGALVTNRHPLMVDDDLELNYETFN